MTRKKYINLVDSVKGSGGTAHVFSSMHVSGEREFVLSSLAILFLILINTVIPSN